MRLVPLRRAALLLAPLPRAHRAQVPGALLGLLGQLGASRRVKRAEVDEIEEEAGDASKKTWSDSVAKVIKSGKAVAANVCEWTQPADTILDKHDEMLVAAATGGPPPVLFIGAALAVVAAVYFVKFA